MALSLINHQSIGDTFSGVYYVESVYVKQTVQKKDYSDFMLRDKSGARNVKYWGKTTIAKGDYVFISAAVDDYQGNPSVVAKNIEKADVPTDLSDYIPEFEENGVLNNASRFDALKANILAIPGGIAETSKTREIVEEVFKNSTFFDKFVKAPGGDKAHYGKQGGLLALVVNVGENAVSLAKTAGLSDKEMVILLTAIILSRVGGIEAYDFENCIPVVTKKGILLGVENLTINRLNSAIRRVAGACAKDGTGQIDQDVILRVLHAVSSSYGNIKPLTKEAIILRAAFESDNKIVESLDFIESDTNVSEEFTAYDPNTKCRYYTGNRA